MSNRHPLNGSNEKRPTAAAPSDLLTQEYLAGCHPFLTPDQVRELLAFCNRETIRHVSCYGDGSIMLPKFLGS